jgi:hypothetical protein
MSIVLELNEAKIEELIDQDTLDYYAMGRAKDIAEVNRDLFKGGQEFIYQDYFLCFMNVSEDGHNLTFLQPYRANVSKHLWKYKFGCLDEQGNIFWFFKNKAKAKNREMAIQIYLELEKYCQDKNLKPFIIKK